MNGPKVARKALYEQLRKANPNANRQLLKNLAYDITREAVKNLKSEETA